MSLRFFQTCNARDRVESPCQLPSSTTESPMVPIRSGCWMSSYSQPASYACWRVSFMLASSSKTHGIWIFYPRRPVCSGLYSQASCLSMAVSLPSGLQIRPSYRGLRNCSCPAGRALPILLRCTLRTRVICGPRGSMAEGRFFH